MVKFKKFNFQDNFTLLGKFDIIMCRYVAIYFSETFKRDVFSKMADALSPGGYFFLGASESMGMYSNRFEMLEHNKGLYYRIRSQS